VKFVVDMNLSPEWVDVFAASGWDAVHWSKLGEGNASDEEIFNWARKHEHILVTQDIDFPQILFASRAGRPSVVLLRIRNELDATQRARVCAAIRKVSASLETGAIMVATDRRIRLRALPIKT
jgi:predicted nuclease of predicted toxin-antitoxin system